MDNNNKIPEQTESICLYNEIEKFVDCRNLFPPLSLDEIKELTTEFINISAVSNEYSDWITVMINNCLWKETIAGVPYENRILLLPQCLRNAENCKADFDQFGLICSECGLCSIYELKKEAERLGIMTLVAEGTTAITGLIGSGQIDAVIGVSCIVSLEKAFSHIVKHAVPGIAIPLTNDGCKNTAVNSILVRNALNLKSGNHYDKIEPEKLKQTVRAWFNKNSLIDIITKCESPIEQTAVEYLIARGKRWRPYLTAAVYSSLKMTNDMPRLIRESAVAIECFHKASLIHDDIEDNDDKRYGEKTLHCSIGIPSAINIGDLLIGEGYRIIANADTDAETKIKLMQTAAQAHKDLCIGQGEELELLKTNDKLTIKDGLRIYSLKTAPAFETALLFGAICAQADELIISILKNFSRSLGIAYQLLDDIEDKTQFIDADEQKIKQLYEHYKKETIRTLRPLQSTELKRLLFRITGKIFKDV